MSSDIVTRPADGGAADECRACACGRGSIGGCVGATCAAKRAASACIVPDLAMDATSGGAGLLVNESSGEHDAKSSKPTPVASSTTPQHVRAGEQCTRACSSASASEGQSLSSSSASAIFMIWRGGAGARPRGPVVKSARGAVTAEVIKKGGRKRYCTRLLPSRGQLREFRKICMHTHPRPHR